MKIVNFTPDLDTIGTRNCRLAALRSFFGFVAAREPTALVQCTAILQVPVKRAPIRAPSYLEPDEVKAILAQPDRSTIEGQRDHALLSFLYNTGARIQEALNVCPQAIRLDPPACVRLFGKGRKERVCPLWPETVSLLRALLKRQPRADSEPIFVNRYGNPLGASGARFKLATCVKAAATTAPTLKAKHVTPHSFRHPSAYCTTFQSWFILKTIGLGRARFAGVYGRLDGPLSLVPAPPVTASHLSG